MNLYLFYYFYFEQYLFRVAQFSETGLNGGPDENFTASMIHVLESNWLGAMRFLVNRTNHEEVYMMQRKEMK